MEAEHNDHLVLSWVYFWVKNLWSRWVHFSNLGRAPLPIFRPSTPHPPRSKQTYNDTVVWSVKLDYRSTVPFAGEDHLWLFHPNGTGSWQHQWWGGPTGLPFDWLSQSLANTQISKIWNYKWLLQNGAWFILICINYSETSVTHARLSRELR